MSTTELHHDLLELPAYGLGAAGLGNLYTSISDDEAQQALSAAAEGGLAYIDTAPFYGHGLSEERVGRYLASAAHRPVLSTKVGRVLTPADGRLVPDNGFASPAPNIPAFDYSATGIRASFAGSCERLGVDAVDILLLHDIGEMTHGSGHKAVLAQAVEESLPEMEAMKAEGKAKWIGLGVNEIEVCEAVLERAEVDVFLIAGRYTLMEHESTLPFLEECHERGIRIIIGGAFNSGLLVAAPDEPKHFDYALAPSWAEECADQFREICAAHDTPLPAAALQFCQAHPAVTSVIPGARTAEQVRQVIEWAKRPIPPSLWEALKDQSMICRNAPVPS